MGRRPDRRAYRRQLQRNRGASIAPARLQRIVSNEIEHLVVAATKALSVAFGPTVVESDCTKGCDHVVRIARCQANDRGFVIKVPVREPQKIFAQRESTTAAAVAGVPVPCTLLEDEGGRWMVEPLVPGTLLSDMEQGASKDLVCACYRELGVSMGNLHSIGISGFGELRLSKSGVLCGSEKQPQRPDPSVSEWAALLAEGVVTQSEYEALQLIWDTTPKAPSVLLHGDVFPDNVLCDASGLTGLIDFGDSYAGDAMADFARMFLVRFGMPEWDALVEGYESIGGVIDLERVGFHAAAILSWQLPGASDPWRSIALATMRRTLVWPGGWRA